MDYFYDGQTRKWVVQFVRVLSDYFVEYGVDDNGNTILQRVPVTYAQTSKQASTILIDNSENKMPTVPAIVVYIEDYQYARQRVQDPTFVDTKQIRELLVQNSQETHYQGTGFTVERLMPMPFDIKFNVDIWTSSTDQKLQLFEQIVTKFNPAYEVQSTDNYIDWTSLSAIFLEDVRWSSKSVGNSQSTDIDIMTFKFSCPVFITAPAKLKRLGVITDIIASIYDGDGNLVDAIINRSELLGNRQYFSPQGYKLLVTNSTMTLGPEYGPIGNNTNLGSPTTPVNIPWKPLIDKIGCIQNGVSQAVVIDPITGKTIIGEISINPMNQYQLLFNPDSSTIELDSLPRLTSIIDPTQTGPGAGLPAAAVGQRYLLVNDVGNPNCLPEDVPIAWQSQVRLFAHKNDIIEYDGLSWNVIFDSQNDNLVKYVTNNTNNIQYMWTGSYWKNSWNGQYPEGFWGLIL
jgi:hypothetical protein